MPDYGTCLRDKSFAKYMTPGFLQYAIGFGRIRRTEEKDIREEHQFGMKLTPEEINDIILYLMDRFIHSR